MTLRTVFRRAAVAEFCEARAWYDSRREGLGDEFVECVEAALASAERAPEQHQRVHGDIRRILVRRFPYGVFYVIENNTLVVLAIFHCAREPIIWKSR